MNVTPIPDVNAPNAKPLPSTVVRDDESALVAAAKRGDLNAFQELVTRYEDKIYRLAWNITRNKEDAEDAMQDAFMKAFQHLAGFEGGSRFYTWLVRIAVNEALMKLRRRRSNREVPMDDSEDENGDVVVREFADWKPNPEQQFAQGELERILQAAANKLSPGFRTVFYLRDVEGLSTEETAELLDLTEGAVKARLFRARLRLREELSKIFK